MDTLLTIIQGIAVAGLAAVGVFSKKGRTLFWVLLIGSSIVYISTTIMKEKRNDDLQRKYHRQIQEIRDKLFDSLAFKVMESPKEISHPLAPKPTRQLQITTPQNNSQISARTYVEGHISDPKDRVWLVIHPMETSAYWVQPSIAVGEDGTWGVTAYFGRSSNIDVGKRFEIMAVANPRVSLVEGDVLSGWPEAQWSSQVIGVIRK